MPDVSTRDWHVAMQCVTGATGITYHVPNLNVLDQVIIGVSYEVSREKRLGHPEHLAQWLGDLDRLIDRRVYLCMLPDESMPVDGCCS